MKPNQSNLVCIFFALLVGLCCDAHAKAPYATIRVSSLQRVNEIAESLAERGLQTSLEKQLKASLEVFDGMLDQERAIGVFVVPSERISNFVFFLPLTGSADLASSLQNRGVPVEVDDDGIINAKLGRDFYFRTSVDYCYIASARSDLKNVPASPSSWFDEQATGDLVVTIPMKNIPAKTKYYAIDRLIGWFSDSQSNNQIIPSFSAKGIAVQELARIAEVSDRCGLRVNLDANAGLDCQLRFDGPKVARIANADSELSRFLLPKSSSSGTYRTRLSDDQLAQVNQWATLVRSGFQKDAESTSIEDTDQQELVVRLVRDATQMVESFVAIGEIDIAFAQNESVSAVGLQCRGADQVVEKLIAMVEQVRDANGPVRDVELSDSRINGSQVIEFSVSGDALNSKFESDWVQVALVAASKGIWLAVGKEPVGYLLEIAGNKSQSIGPLCGRFASDSNDADLMITSDRKPEGLAVSIELSSQALGSFFPKSAPSKLTNNSVR